jgi:hypothetical protein
MRRTILAPLLACLALASACSGGSRDESTSAPARDAGMAAPSPETPDALSRQRAPEGKAIALEEGRPPAADQAGSAPGTQPAVEDTSAPAVRMIIRNGAAVVEVDSLEPAVARVERLAAGLGGYVGNVTITGGDRQMRSASLQLKIPAQRFDQALAGLRPVGRVESVSSTAEDVGEEYVDVTARMDNARRLEARLVELLTTRTGKLEDVLAVERELARVREEIERYQGRLRYLRTRAAMSTLEVSLHEPSPLVGDYPGQNPIIRAFGEAWSNFVRFVAWFIAALGVLIPLGVIVFALVWFLRRFWPRRRTPPPPPPGYAPPA